MSDVSAPDVPKRNVGDVIKKLIPIFKEQNLDTARLEKIQSDSWFRAPEVAVVDWQILGEYLEDLVEEGVLPLVINNDTPKWVWDIQRIMAGDTQP